MLHYLLSFATCNTLPGVAVPLINPDVIAVPPLATGNVPVTLLAKFID